MIQRIKDLLRERRIRRMGVHLMSADPQLRSAIWRVIQAEINMRSPAQIARMERVRGLA